MRLAPAVLAALALLPLALRAEQPAQARSADSFEVSAAEVQPVSFTQEFWLGAGQTDEATVFAGRVPRGYALVIDHVSVHAALPSGQQASASVQASEPSAHAAIPLIVQEGVTPGEKPAAGAEAILEAHVLVGIPVAFGQSVQVSLRRDRAAGRGFCRATIFGHLVKV